MGKNRPENIRRITRNSPEKTRFKKYRRIIN